MPKFYERIIASILHPDKTAGYAHIAELLGFGASDVETLKRATPAEREELFSSLIEPEHGGVVDWRCDVFEVYELLRKTLDEVEYASLPSPEALTGLKPEKLIEELSEHLAKYPFTLRLIESTGDHWYLLKVPTSLVAEFDKTAKKWALL